MEAQMDWVSGGYDMKGSHDVYSMHNSLRWTTRLDYSTRLDSTPLDSTRLDSTRPLHLSTLRLDRPLEVAQLQNLVTVVDCSTFLKEMSSQEALSDRQWQADEEDQRGIAGLLFDQVELLGGCFWLRRCGAREGLGVLGCGVQRKTSETAS